MSTRYDLDGTERAMKTPILASFFRAVGGLIVLATVLLVVAGVSRDEKIGSIPTAVIVAGSGGLIALVFFGIAQVLTSIARIESHARNEKQEAILSSLHKIEGHLAAMREKKKDA